MVVARAILGEWLGGSGGGWQDSGGVFPGVKIIQGVLAGEGDPEAGISRGRLLAPARDPGRRSSEDGERRRTGVPPAARRQPGPGPRRDGAERRPGPEHGDGEVPAPEQGRVGGPAGGAADLRGDRRRGPGGGHPGAGLAHDPELGRADQGDHPLGEQPVHRDDHPRGQGGAGDRLLGLPDARRDVGRRDGLLRRPGPQGQLPGGGRGDPPAGQGGARRRPAVRDGAGGLRLPDQPARDVRRAARSGRRPDAAAVLHLAGPGDDRGGAAPWKRPARPTSTASPTGRPTPASCCGSSGRWSTTCSRSAASAGRSRARPGRRPPRRSGPPTGSTRSATSRRATTSGAGGSA